jgi:hypothetical protein
MQMNILDFIQFDVGFALQKLKEQLKKNQSTVLLIRGNRTLFDTAKLKEYLSQVSLQNTFLLRDILKKAIAVIKMHNNDFGALEELEEKRAENITTTGNPNETAVLWSRTPFEYITVEDKTIFYAIQGENGYDDFLKNDDFEVFRSQEFAIKCRLIVNILTAAYPELKNTVTHGNAAVHSFELLSNVRTTDCFNTLVRHEFIDPKTDKVHFKKIFQGKQVLNKIEWTGTLRELSRFAFFLQHSDKHLAPCKKTKWQIAASKCFSIEGKVVPASVIQNNNRKTIDEIRLGYLIAAITHLNPPK